MKRIILLFVLLSFYIFSNAQTKGIDSLIKTLDTISSSQEKVKNLNKISQQFANIDYEKALDYGFQAYHLAQQLNFPFGLTGSCYNLGSIYFRTFKLDSALKYGEIGLRIANDNNLSKMKFAHLNLLSLIQKKKGNIPEAIRISYKFLNICEQMKDTASTVAALINLGSLQMSNGDTTGSRNTLLRALSLLNNIQIPQYSVAAYTNIYHVEKDKDRKEQYLKKALTLAIQNNFKYYIGVGYKTYGYFYFTEKVNYDSALYYYKKAEKLAREAKDLESLNNIESLIATLYQKKGKPDSSIAILSRIIPGIEAQHDLQELENLYYTLALSYADKGQFRQAFNYLRLNKSVSDTLQHKELAKQIALANTKYNSKKKDDAILLTRLEIQHQKKQKRLILIISILLLISIAFAFYAIYNLVKRKKEEAEKALSLQRIEAEKLREIDEFKMQFFTDISHELKTPLSLIINPLDSALKTLNNSQVYDHLKLAYKSSLKLLRLVMEIMDFSRLENGQIKLSIRKTLLKPFLDNIVNAFKNEAKLQNIKLTYNISIPDNTIIEIDDRKLEMILNNLISNAIKFSNEGGEIIFNVLQKEEHLAFEVIDEGIGIHHGEINKVFDRFFQSSHTRKHQNPGGTGIGLALAKSLTELLCGSLSVESELGKGSKFTLTLPMVGCEDTLINSDKAVNHFIPTPSKKSIKSLIKPNESSNSILIVEDNTDMLGYLNDIFSPYYHCITAQNGEEAFELIIKHDVDLIISDIMMPQMSGFELKEKVNSSNRYAQIPFIFLTARSLKEDIIKGLKLGVDDYITKPFLTEELLARVYNLIQNKIERERWRDSQLDLSDQSLEKESSDELLLNKAIELVKQNISNAEFKVADLAQQLNYSERQLRRVIKKLTGLSPVSFILEIRLKHAYKLIVEQQFSTINEVRFEIGIESASYFTTKFKDRFGISPTFLLNNSTKFHSSNIFEAE